ncbi:MFS transporter [Tannerella forsythia]|nr:major facilitator transporter [Tannerella forsythia]OLQ21440.1 MFS transporter [Tannerella forsythia]PDP70541.1 MFS transporter [Tannerella forsythia]TPE15583.1 sugar MFS transporter [Tannerella forsythia]
MMSDKKNYTLPIIVMIFLFGMISFVTNLASPMGDILKFQFNVPNWMGTLGVFANFIAYAVMGYPAGNLLQKFGYKKTALIAISIGFAGVGIQTLSGTMESFGVYLLGAFIAGFSMCLLNTVVNPMLNSLGGGGNKGNQLIQIGGSFNSLCGTAVIILTGILIPEGIKNAQISNVFPLMYAALAIFAFAFLVIALTAIPEKDKEQQVSSESSQYSPLSFRHFILGAVGIFVYVGVEVGIPNILNKWLQNPDLDVLQLGGMGNAEAIAGSVTATYWLLMLVGRLLGAAIGSKVSAKSMLLVASGLGLVLTLVAMFAPVSSLINLPVFKNDASGLFGLVQVPVSAALLVLIGLCTSVMWGGIFNLAVEGLGKYTEKASGIFMVMVCGGGILPLLQNAIVDMKDGIGYMASYWVIVAGLIYLLYYALIGCKNVNKDIPVN